MLALLPKLNEINIKLKRILGKKVALSSLNLMIPIFTVLTRYDYTFFASTTRKHIKSTS